MRNGTHHSAALVRAEVCGPLVRLAKARHAATLRGSRLDVGGLVVEGVVPLELRELGDEVVDALDAVHLAGRIALIKDE